MQKKLLKAKSQMQQHDFIKNRIKKGGGWGRGFRWGRRASVESTINRNVEWQMRGWAEPKDRGCGYRASRKG